MWAKNTAHASVAHCLFAKFFLRVWTSVLSPVENYDDTKSILKANIFSKTTTTTTKNEHTQNWQSN